MTENCSINRRPARRLSPTIARIRRWVILAAAILGLLFAASPPARGDAFSEYQVKAVFLYNLVNFVQWPPPSLNETDAFFTIGILGDDPFGKTLDRTVSNETVCGRAIRIVRYTDPAELDKQRCQLLFITLDISRTCPELYTRLCRKGILTVSDQDGFVSRGGMINLLTSGKRIQLEINLDNASQAGLKISSKLLNLARVVK